VRFDDGAKLSGIISCKDYYATMDDGKDVGSICHAMLVPGPLGDVHQRIPPEADFTYNRVSERQAVLVPNRADCPSLKWNKPHTDDGYITVETAGERTITVKNKKAINSISKGVTIAMENYVKSNYGITQNMFVNNGIIVAMLDPDSDRHTDDELINAVIAANPTLKERFKYAPDIKSSNCNGLYVCDPVTNVWVQRHNAYVEEAMLEMFNRMELSPADKKHVESRRGGNDLLYWLGRKVLDEGFSARLDSNLDLFAVDNGVFDSSKGGLPLFRPIQPEDMIATTAGWSYDQELAKKHRLDVEPSGCIKALAAPQRGCPC
jgi:hypothetical protein